MGWMQLMSSKVGHLLSHSSDTANPSSYGNWHPYCTDGGHNSEADKMGPERDRERYHLRRAHSESSAKDEFWGPDTSSLSAFLYSFFSNADAEEKRVDDELMGQSHDEGKCEVGACCNSSSKLRSTLYQVATSTLVETLQKETFDDKIEKSKLESGSHDEDLEEADWHVVSQNEIGNLASQGRKQEPSNFCGGPLVSHGFISVSQVSG